MPNSPILQQPPPPNRYPANPSRNEVNPAIPAYFDFSQSRQQRRAPRSIGFTPNYQGPLGTSILPFRQGFSDDAMTPKGVPAEYIKGRLSGWGEPPNISTHLDTQKIQNALRAAERGEMTLLYQIYRDYVLANSHLQTEFAKRKMAVIGQPWTLKPWKARGEKKAKPEDIKAVQVIEAMIEKCTNWQDGLIHMMDATLWPCAVNEKIVEPNIPGYELYDDSQPGIRWWLKTLDPVSPFLHSYKLAYLAAGGFQLPMNVPNVVAPNALPLQMNEPGDTVWNPDTWEPDLRFFRTFPNGYIDYSWANMYAPDPMRHSVHRGSILSRSIRDNYGAMMRATLFWTFFMLDARTRWARAMGKYGQPFILAEANMADVNTLNFLREAFDNCSQIGGMLVNQGAKAQMVQAMSTNLSQGWKIFMDFCNGEISKLVIGHEGSSTAKPEGLNSNQEQSAKDVAENIRIFDQMMLRRTLRTEFAWYLKLNGYDRSHPPIITWGGLSEEDATELLTQIKLAKEAGLELTDDGIEHVGNVCGLEYRRAPEPTATGVGMSSKPQPASA